MSRIQQIMPLYGEQKKSKSVSSNYASKRSFGKTSVDALGEDIIDYGKKHIIPKKWSIGGAFRLLQSKDGEIQNQIVNALFTGSLATVVIAYNPISKTDEKTKKYMALRQPVSAATAVAFSLLATIPANIFIENALSNGHLETNDLRVKPDESHLKRLFKKEYAAAQKAGALEQFKADNTPKDWAQEFNVEAFVKSRREKAEVLFTRILHNDPKVLQADLKGQVKGLDSYIAKHNLHELDTKAFLKEKFKIEFTESGKLKRHAFEKKLKEINAMDFLREFGLIKSEFDPKTGGYGDGHFTEEHLRAFLAFEHQDDHLVKSLMKMGVSKEKAREFSNEMGKTIARQIEHSSNHNEETVKLGHLIDILGIKEDFIKDIENNKMIVTLQNLSEKHLKDLVVERSGAKVVKLGQKTIPDISKQLMKNIIKKTESDAKNMKKYFGLVVALVSLPFSCTALNWLYPRFVKLVAPSLADGESANGGTK